VTVKVTWHEGKRERDLEVTQFLTRPQEGQLATSEMLGLPQAADAMGQAFGNNVGQPAQGSNPPTNPVKR
jgi:hypothetical protein